MDLEALLSVFTLESNNRIVSFLTVIVFIVRSKKRAVETDTERFCPGTVTPMMNAMKLKLPVERVISHVCQGHLKR